MNLEKLKYLENLAHEIQNSLNCINNNWYEIAKNLYIIDQENLYKEIPGFYNNITDYAEYQFEIKKSTTYNLLAVYKNFILKDYERFIKYDFRKLVSLLPYCNDENILSKINIDMSLRTIITVINNYKNSTRVENEIAENQQEFIIKMKMPIKDDEITSKNMVENIENDKQLDTVKTYNVCPAVESTDKIVNNKLPDNVIPLVTYEEKVKKLEKEIDNLKCELSIITDYIYDYVNKEMQYVDENDRNYDPIKEMFKAKTYHNTLKKFIYNYKFKQELPEILQKKYKFMTSFR